MIDSSVVRLLVDNYGLAEDGLTIDRIKSGVENANYFVVARTQKYVFRVYNAEHSIRGARSSGSIKLEFRFMHEAGSHGLPVPGLVPLADGDFLGHDAGVFFALFSYIPGVEPSDFSGPVARELAHAVDILYAVGAAFRQPDDPSSLSIDKRALAQYEKLSQSSPVLGQSIAGTIHILHSQLFADAQFISNLETGFVHGDIKLENTLFLHDKLQAILDFDDYRYSYLLEDTVMALMHNLHDPAKNCIRSGKYDDFIRAITNSQLLSEIDSSLKTLLRARFLYDVCKYILNDNVRLVEQLLDDKHVHHCILS
jgi:Ser/Thr protein kinase RdoA (MazF antagonist)